MTNKDPAILRAERLRAIIQMPEYGDTIGKWLDEACEQALHDMTQAVEPHQFHSAQGAYRALNAFKDQFARVFSAEQSVVDREQRKNYSSILENLP